MDQDLLVAADGRINAGLKLLQQLVRDQFVVAAAFWTETEGGQFRFHIVNKDVATDGLLQTYKRLHTSLGRVTDVGFSWLELDLLGTNEPAAVQVADLLARHPGRAGVSLQSRILGEQMIEWGYIDPERFYHPAPESEVAEKLFSQLFGLIGRGSGPFPPSHVALRNGHSFDGVPVEFTVAASQPSTVKFAVTNEVGLREVPASEIVSIF